MADVLKGISEDVPFDFAAAADLITAFTNTAATIEGQAGSRTAWKNAALADFRGHFSELFRTNQATAHGDATELATRLREVATLAGQLKTAAHSEQKRREVARKWKHDQDHKSLLDKGHDFLFGEDAPPVGPPDTPPHLQPATFQPKARQTPSPTGGGRTAAGVSSARPSDLRTFASHAANANQTLHGSPGSLRSHLSSFASRCRWGSLHADTVMAGFDKFHSANVEDAQWAKLLADAFAAAGGEGNVSSLSDAALASTLKAHGVSASRTDLVIDPPTAFGHPPTTGYANDPVNTSTGNFVETETDLGFTGAASTLTMSRTYNSCAGDDPASGFGPGWSSWTEARLVLLDDAARMVLPDGRQLRFARLGSGWDRAIGESMWLSHDGDDGLQVVDNAGTAWSFTGAGVLRSVSQGPHDVVSLSRDDEGRLMCLSHARGRSITLEWGTDGTADRVLAAQASDGRRFEYTYDSAGQLVSVLGPRGTRTYNWNDDGLIAEVIDIDGTVEVENTYDEGGRVTRQRSPFGRLTRFAYLPGRVTVVSDEDGTRSNTWIADDRGRLIGVLDAHDQRQSMSYDDFGNPVLVTERDGATTVSEYDARGRRTRQVSPGGADLTWTYDDLDRVTSVSTQEGATTLMDYDGAERNPSSITDPEGGVTRLVWVDGLMTTLIDPMGVTLRFTHDADGNLISTTDAAGNVARLDRDKSGRVVAAITPSGHMTAYSWSESGELASRRDPDGALWRFEHTQGHLTAVIDPLGARTMMEIGPNGQLTSSTDPLGRSVSRSFDALGNVTGVELPDGSTWQFTHDALSRLVSTIGPDGATWHREYDRNGTPTSVVDPHGVRQIFALDRSANTASVSDGLATSAARFDSLGRQIAVEASNGGETLITYDRCGRPVEVVDAEGGLTLIRRDAAGRPVKVTTPGGSTTSFEYDPCGRLASQTDALGATTSYTYDADGRVSTVTAPTGEVSRAEYDPCGRLLTQITPGQGVARYRYDAVGRVISSSDTWNGRRKFRYDAAGQLIEAENGNGGRTRFGHDVMGRVVTITDPLGATTQRAYDATGNLVSETDPLGRETTAGYDRAGRQLWQQDPTGRRTTWTYDDSGRVQQLAVDGRTISQITRDLRGRTLSVLDTVEEGAEPVQHTLTYNARNQLIRRARDDQWVTWTYDADGRRSSMTTPDDVRTSYQWDAAGRLVGLTHPLLGRAAFECDASGRLVASSTGSLLQTWEYAEGYLESHSLTDESGVSRTLLSHDDDGRLTGVERDGVRTRYEHDDACQLIKAHLRSDGAEVDVRWRYDAAGRLVSETAQGVTRDYSYDAAGQLLTLTVTNTDDASARVLQHSYDDLGRRTSSRDDSGWSSQLAWSANGWLSGVTQTRDGVSEHTALRIDAFGELAAINDTPLMWDSATGFGSTPVLAGNMTVLSSPGATGIGSQWFSPGWRSARATGSPVGAEAMLDPWGVSPMQSFGDREGLSGFGISGAGELTFGHGLEWLGARVYDSASRGFLSADPLDAVIGAGWSGNGYSYAGNDPLHALDPLGLRPVTDAELKAYTAAHQGALHAAGEWAKNNWEYVAGGAMVVAGGVLIATGVGGPAGMMLISAGADTIIQKATTGHVNWGEVAISGAVGGIGGGAVSLAAKASEGGVAALRTTVLVNGGVGALGSDAVYGYRVATGQEEFSVQRLLGNTVAGGVAGGIGGAAGPGGGTIARELGQSSTSLTAKAATAGLNFTAGFGGNVAGGIVSGQGIDPLAAAKSGLFSSAVGAGTDKAMSHFGVGPTGTGTLNQLSYFGPRTVSGAFNMSATNTRAMWGSAGIGAGVGFFGP